MSGNNGYGQLADGTTTSSNTFKKANISDVIAISAGSSTMHALKKDGTVWSGDLTVMENMEIMQHHLWQIMCLVK